MKGPICAVCLNSDILCRSCNKRLDSGEVSDADVRVSRALFRMSGSLKLMREITVKKVAETGRYIIIVCGRGDAARCIGKSGSTAKKLEKELGKKVLIVEQSPDVNGFIKSLFPPSRVSWTFPSSVPTQMMPGVSGDSLMVTMEQ